MKRYFYQARTEKAEKVKGIVESVDKKQAVSVLRQRGLIVVSLKAMNASFFYRLRVLLSRVTFNEVVSFTRQFSTMMTSGLSLTESLVILRDQANPALSRVLNNILEDIQGGSSLYKAMSAHPRVFSKIYLALIKSGETAGVLDEVLQKLSDNLEKQRDFRSKVKGAMIYPIIITISMIGVGILMMIFVIPKMLDMYKEFTAQLPGATQLLINIMEFMSSYWLFVLAVGTAFGYGLVVWRKTPIGRKKLDKLILKTPIIGNLQQQVILTNVTRTLGMLVGAGVSIIDSLNIVAETANNFIYEDVLKKTAKGVEKGLPLAATLGRYEYFPPLVAQMIAVGEETGKLDDVLIRMSKQFEAESEMALKALTTVIEPLMMIVLGIGVGFLVIAIILPIYNLTAQF